MLLFIPWSERPVVETPFIELSICTDWKCCLQASYILKFMCVLFSFSLIYVGSYTESTPFNYESSLRSIAIQHVFSFLPLVLFHFMKIVFNTVTALDFPINFSSSLLCIIFKHNTFKRTFIEVYLTYNILLYSFVLYSDWIFLYLIKWSPW